ncbi:RNA pseudouridine synthase [Shewanella sp. SNU WT4]|uniref:RluA family pseudouridine synthase n=1 Tax=Shewanella sp. SNU WT4 TaxID=2590015 RepID=UPI0011268759|nr:RluA family pseudouridine synthase [Shewanella sp. SNU WT4]QDF68493.1 RNA pseudouridine synthase [Shewanella sp. SNU WT4]
MSMTDACFTLLPDIAQEIELPARFTFPFYYQPHPLCVLAAQSLQAYLSAPHEWQHNFGLNDSDAFAIGKMFGVLVVRNQAGELGYLSAFSGKLANSNHITGFAPPVYDMLQADNFFVEQKRYIDDLNRQVTHKQAAHELSDCQLHLKQIEQQADLAIAALRQAMIVARAQRKLAREQWQAKRDSAKGEDLLMLEQQGQTLALELSQQSVREKLHLRDTKLAWQQQIDTAQHALSRLTRDIEQLQTERKQLSNELQQRLFEQYRFLNIKGESKSLHSIFTSTVELTPPAGSGECAAPKLLHYAFSHNYQPIAMAEFWWGASPKSQVRQHKYYYPACQRKCHPILSHMLQGLTVDDNPLLQNTAAGKSIEIIYQDDALAIINKPAEFLSVPGKQVTDSVFSRAQLMFPAATGPLIVHRLDMSTSGLMVIALTKDAHKALQRQFIQRTASKRYVALIDGKLSIASGTISLPLRGDLDDRPRQLVCHEHGKEAITEWQVIEHIGQKTKLYLYPKTGRTHQLRVHCAHARGLNMPMVGDDLYGQVANRLHLHAESLTLSHPMSGKLMTFQVDADF